MPRGKLGLRPWKFATLMNKCELFWPGGFKRSLMNSGAPVGGVVATEPGPLEADRLAFLKTRLRSPPPASNTIFPLRRRPRAVSGRLASELGEGLLRCA
jgi:hypothetical protein